MSPWFLVLTVLFIIVSAIMILIILVQRPQGGGLAGAFGGAAGAGTDTVFGGRVGDALTVMTVIAFSAYLVLALGLNVLDNSSGKAPSAAPAALTTSSTQPATTRPAAPTTRPGMGLPSRPSAPSSPPPALPPATSAPGR